VRRYTSFEKSGNYTSVLFATPWRYAEPMKNHLEQIMKPVAVNDPVANLYAGFNIIIMEKLGGQPDRTKDKRTIRSRAADLGYSKAHYLLADINRQCGGLKKTKFQL
jgi:hypothetical protein